jgi:16S rRNA (guanine1207-N2)-methyltransferase
MSSDNVIFDQIFTYHQREDPRFLNQSCTNVLLGCPPSISKILNFPLSNENAQIFQPNYSDFQFLNRIANSVAALDKIQGTFSQSLVFAQKDKKFSLAILAKLMMHTEPNGLITLVAHNQIGGSSYIPIINKLSSSVVASSKAHYRIISFPNNQQAPELLDWLMFAEPQRIPHTNYSAAPGMFSYKKIDLGTSLLLEAIAKVSPEDRSKLLSGHGADLGCGWGYLGGSILSDYHEPKMCSFVEVDFPSVIQAETNLSHLKGRTDFIWADIATLTKTQPKIEQSLDWVVCNPPFHESKSADPELGLNFIQVAHSILKKDGHLILVANSHLPYKALLNTLFTNAAILYNGKGFHVYLARK